MTLRIWTIGAALLAVCATAAAKDDPPTAEAAKANVSFGSAAAYGGLNQNTAICMIANVGKSAVKLKKVRIYDQSGEAIWPSGAGTTMRRCDMTAISLNPRETCLAVSAVGVEGAYSCSTSVSAATDLRGSLSISRSPDNSIGASVPME